MCFYFNLFCPQNQSRHITSQICKGREERGMRKKCGGIRSKALSLPLSLSLWHLHRALAGSCSQVAVRSRSSNQSSAIKETDKVIINGSVLRIKLRANYCTVIIIMQMRTSCRTSCTNLSQAVILVPPCLSF